MIKSMKKYAIKEVMKELNKVIKLLLEIWEAINAQFQKVILEFSSDLF